MLSVLLTAALLATPAADNLKPVPHPAVHWPGLTKAQRLVNFIVQTNPKAKPYARRLVDRTLAESKHFKLDPAIMLAIAWTESDFWHRVRGSSGEFGVWQIWRYGSLAAKGWDHLQREGRTKGYPDKAWRKLGRLTQQRVLQDMDLATALAAYSIKVMVSWCRHRVKHRVHRWLKPGLSRSGARVHRDTFGVYAHYNSGTRWPRRGYEWRLRKRTKIVRSVIRGK